MKKPTIIDSPWTFIVAVLFVGPLALPLLWRNPNLSKTTKWAGSVIVVLFTLFLIFFAKQVLESLLEKIVMQSA